MSLLFHSPEDLAEVLKVTPKTLANWRSQRTGPKAIRIQGGLVRYRDEDFQAWLQQQVDQSDDWWAA